VRGCGLSKRSSEARQGEHHIPLWANVRRDLNTAFLLSKNHDTPANHVCYHAHAAVEKASKALLSKNHVKYPYVHDLEELFRLVSNECAPIPESYFPLLELTSFALEFRYTIPLEPDEFPLMDVLKRSREFVEWVAEVGDFKL